MITGETPRELPAKTIQVDGSGNGSVVYEAVGYADSILVDVPANETYGLQISGPAGKEYFSKPAATYTGDTTIEFTRRIPCTGKMTVSVVSLAGGTLPNSVLVQLVGALK